MVCNVHNKNDFIEFSICISHGISSSVFHDTCNFKITIYIKHKQNIALISLTSTEIMFHFLLIIIYLLYISNFPIFKNNFKIKYIFQIYQPLSRYFINYKNNFINYIFNDRRIDRYATGHEVIKIFLLNRD